MIDPHTKENITVAAVQSILLIASAVTISYFAGPIGKTSPDFNEMSLSAAASPTNCPGVKLNYPRVIKENLPNGKRTSFRYNCVQSGFLATSYDGNCKGCSGRTRLTDEPVRWGICAVDTDVIRSYKDTHTKFYVPGYGPCKAADTGGAVKGKKIDLGFDDIRNGWWSQRYNPTDIYTLVR